MLHSCEQPWRVSLLGAHDRSPPRFPNVLVVATSNLTGAIDAAFIDRADIKQYVGPPGLDARYAILASCLAELGRAGVVALAPPGPLSLDELRPMVPRADTSFVLLARLTNVASVAAPHSLMLYALARECDGLSGRALRKLPLLAHALFAPSGADGRALEAAAFLRALHRAIAYERASRGALGQ